MQITAITVTQLCSMFFFMAIGYFFTKRGILTKEAGGNLSKLIVNIFLPAMVVLSFSNNFKLDVLRDKLMLLIFSVIILAITGVLAIFLAKLFSKNRSTQNIYIYSFTIPNLGYMAYPLVKAIYGEAAFLDTLVFCIPFSLYIYTIGMFILTSSQRVSLKGLLNPTLVATFAGIIIGLLNIKLPSVAVNILEMAEGAVTPCAMILTGTVFARINMKSVFIDWRSYVASAIRLLIIPIACLFIFKLLGISHSWIISAICVLAMPMGVNSVIFPEAYGGDAESGAKVCFMSAILGIITIPIIFSLI